MGGLFSQEEEKKSNDKPVDDKPVKPVDDTPFELYIGVSPRKSQRLFLSSSSFFLPFTLRSLSLRTEIYIVLILSKVVSHTKTLCYQTVHLPCQTRAIRG